MNNHWQKTAAHYDDAMGGLAIFLGTVIAFAVLMFLIGTTRLEIALEGGNDAGPGRVVAASN